MIIWVSHQPEFYNHILWYVQKCAQSSYITRLGSNNIPLNNLARTQLYTYIFLVVDNNLQQICMYTVSLSAYFTNLLPIAEYFHHKYYIYKNCQFVLFGFDHNIYIFLCTVLTELINELVSCHLFIFNNMLLNYITINEIIFIFLYVVFF